MKRGTKRGLVRVRSGATGAERLAFYSRPGKGGCILWVGHIDRLGYGRIQWQRRHQRAHRVAWEVANGPIPHSGIKVCHVCDTRNCINVAHLFLGTQQDNLKDMTIKGRRPSRLTPEIVKRIRDAIGTSEEIAEQFGISAGSVYRAKRLGWKHIPTERTGLTIRERYLLRADKFEWQLCDGAFIIGRFATQAQAMKARNKFDAAKAA